MLLKSLLYENRTFLYISLLLLIFSCKEEISGIRLKIEKKNQIIETEEAYLNFIVNWVVDEKNNTIYFSSNRNQVLKLNVENGKLSSIYEADSNNVAVFYKGLVNHFSSINFEYTPTKLENNYTVLVDRFYLNNDTLYVNLTSQFYIDGYFNEMTASIYTFFSSVLMINKKTGKLIKTYYIPNHITSNFTSSNSKSNYISTQKGLMYKDEYLYFTNGGNVNTDSLNLLFKIPESSLTKMQNNASLSKIDIDSFLIDLKTIDNNEVGRLLFYMSSSDLYNKKLYYSEGKNIYDVENQKVYANLIQKPYQHLKSFNIFHNGNIIYDLNKDTVLDRKIIYYDLKQKKSNVIKQLNENVKKTYFGDKYYYELVIEQEKYYLIKYSYEIE